MLRKVIAVAVATPALTACDLLRDPGPPPDPDVLTDFYQQTLALAAHYDTLVLTTPALGPVRDAHRAHAQALAAILHPPPPSASAMPSPSPSAIPSGPPAGPLALETAARDEAIRICLAAPSFRATLLAEIAVARACHVEILSA